MNDHEILALVLLGN